MQRYLVDFPLEENSLKCSLLANCFNKEAGVNPFNTFANCKVRVTALLSY